MQKYKLNQLKLQSDLRTFGLNPTEWSIQRMQALTYVIKNKSDEQFLMYGQLEYRNQKPRWKFLKVISC